MAKLTGPIKKKNYWEVIKFYYLLYINTLLKLEFNFRSDFDQVNLTLLKSKQQKLNLLS